MKIRLSHQKQPLLIVSYEDMQKNTSREVTVFLNCYSLLLELIVQVFRMLDFLHLHYLSDEVLEKIKYDATAFKRSKMAEFDPYTSQQRQGIHTLLSQFLVWLKEHQKEDFVPVIERYLLQ